MKFCIFCGKQINNDSIFCIYCGKKNVMEPEQTNDSAFTDEQVRISDMAAQNKGIIHPQYGNVQNATNLNMTAQNLSKNGNVQNVQNIPGQNVPAQNIPQYGNYGNISNVPVQNVQNMSGQNMPQYGNAQNIQNIPGPNIPVQNMNQYGNVQNIPGQNMPQYGNVQNMQNMSEQNMPVQNMPQYGNMQSMQNMSEQNMPVQNMPQYGNMQSMQNMPDKNIPAQKTPAQNMNQTGNNYSYTGNTNGVMRPYAETRKAPVTQEKKSKAPAIAISIAAVVTAVGLFLLAYFLFIKDDKKDNEKKDNYASNITTEKSNDRTTEGGKTEASTEINNTAVTSTTETETTESTENTTEAQKLADNSFDGIKARLDTREKTVIKFVSADASEYPYIKVYFTIEDQAGESVEYTLPHIAMKETIANGKELECSIKSFDQIKGREGVRFELVADKSGSMEAELSEMQRIMKEFISELDYNTGDMAEFLAFDTYVMYMCTATNNQELLKNGIDNMTTYGETALYDALYEAIGNAAFVKGAKCIIAFTDGADNRSVKTSDEVINYANQVNVPIFIIGASSGDSNVYNEITSKTGGRYWYIGNINDMNQYLDDIYEKEKKMYCLTYLSDEKADPYADRKLNIVVDDNTYGSEFDSNINVDKTEEMEKHESGYEIVQADISWTEANKAAIRKGGHLITISSQDEMDMAVKMAEEKGLEFVWMGGYTSVRNGAAYGHWITGEDFYGFQAWYPGEPSRTDKDGADEMYLMLWKIGDEWSWNDQRNDPIKDTGLQYFKSKTGYIIEYD
ncbi:Mg-chelatase subunit ChlD [Eubacterium ruminantium]|nr:Mg-chelatase subunit ChlD [Eubacterium ruminantium]